MEHNERMDKVEENLKFLSDSLVEQRRAQMKNDARAEARFEKSEARFEKSEARFEKSEAHIAFMEKHLRHLTELVGLVYDDLEFIGEKTQETSKRLKRNSKA